MPSKVEHEHVAVRLPHRAIHFWYWKATTPLLTVVPPTSLDLSHAISRRVKR